MIGETDTEISRQVLATKGWVLTEWGKWSSMEADMDTLSPCLTLHPPSQVNVKRPMKDETYFEVVESGRYIILLLGKALSVVWDHHLSISVVLKQTHQVSGLPPLFLILSVTCY